MAANQHPEVMEVVAPGLRASLQDLGHAGWRRYGVPPGGAMDRHAAKYANRLLDNPDTAPVLELLLQGARLRILRTSWMAITGARSGSGMRMWRAIEVREGDELTFPVNHEGVWIYLAVEHGFDVGAGPADRDHPWQGRMGQPLQPGDVLRRHSGLPFLLPAGIAGRVVDPIEQWDLNDPPLIRVWPGPQQATFSSAVQKAFYETEWEVTPRSDRVGYRLSGPVLSGTRQQIISEPTLVGTIQIPDDGQPIVTMRDGPTVGGYPKLGVVEPRDVSRLAQCRPGQKVRFEAVG